MIMDKLAVIIAGEIALSKNPGAAMRKWRELFGISQVELAEYLGVSPSTISDYEGGRRKSPGIGVVRRLVDALLEIDRKRGGEVIKRLSKQFLGEDGEPFEVHEFYTALTGEDFAALIDASPVACVERLAGARIYGYTLIDSLRAIVEVPVHEYLKMFGKTPKRAFVFLGVSTGRSPMIAVKVGRFASDMVPEVVVLHGIKQADPVAIKIAEAEKIPLLVTNKPVEEIVRALEDYE